jgi:hypothetical protein
MAKAKSSGQRSSKTGQWATKKAATKAGSTGRSSKSGSGSMVIGRNATTGRFVLAPAVKKSSSFRSNKENVVREVITKRRGK